MKPERHTRSVGAGVICLVLGAATLLLFYPVRDHGFIELDDPDYVTENPDIQAGLNPATLHWAFTTGYAANWHPLTWISHTLDFQMFGLNASGHHLGSVAIHVAATLVLFLALRRMTGAVWRSAAVAALFAWHPLHVESVAWVAERKDVLSGLFFALILWAYARYVEVSGAGSQVSGTRAPMEQGTPEMRNPKPEVAGRRKSSFKFHVSRFTRHPTFCYLLCLAFFLCGLMSKPMLVTVPFVLLLLDYWPLGRLQSPKSKVQSPGAEARPLPLAAHASRSAHELRKRSGATLPTHSASPSTSTLIRLMVEKLPFLLLAIADGIITCHFQNADSSVQSLERLPLQTRLANAVVSSGAYLASTFWPLKLSVFYPYKAVPLGHLAFCLSLLTALSLLVLRARRAQPYLLVGWLWFLGMFLPVIGIVQVGLQARADRYTYLPLIGFFIALVWAVAEGAPRIRLGQRGLLAVTAILLGACFCLGRIQLHYWRDSLTLFRRALEVSSDNAFAHYSLAVALAKQNDIAGAVEHYRAALAIKPDHDPAHNDLGILLARQGQYAEAREQFKLAARHNSKSADAHANLGNLNLMLGNLTGAAGEYSTALRLQPANRTVANLLATTLVKAGKTAVPEADRQAMLDLLPGADLRAQVERAWSRQAASTNPAPSRPP